MDNVVDQIVDNLRNSGSLYFPEHTELKAVRVVGHTPKPEHCTFEIVLAFSVTASASTRRSTVLEGWRRDGRTG
jgi:hypothetical protein